MEAGEHVATLARLTKQPVHQLGQQPATGVGRQHADPGDSGGLDTGATRHGRVEAERSDHPDARVAVPRGERVALVPRCLARFERLVVDGTAQQRNPERVDHAAPLVDRNRPDVEVTHLRTFYTLGDRIHPDFSER